MNITDITNTIYFPYELDQIQVPATQPVPVVLASADGTPLFTTRLTPSATGIVTITDLAPLLNTLCDDTPHKFTLTAGTHTATFTCIPSRVPITTPASTFVQTQFLTLLTGTKHTYTGATEYVSLWSDTTTAATLTVTHTSLSGTTPTTITTTHDITLTPGINTFAIVIGEGFAVKATIGQLTQTYTVIRHATPPTTLLFTNNFGAVESFHFFGTLQREHKPTRESAVISGRTVNYNIQSVPTHKATTSPLPDTMFALFDDILTTHSLWRHHNNTDTHLTITDSEWQHTNSPAQLATGTLTWREQYGAPLHHPAMPKDIFDFTFDQTYE